MTDKFGIYKHKILDGENSYEETVEVPPATAEHIVWDSELRGYWREELKFWRSEYNTILENELDQILIDHGYTLPPKEIKKMKKKLIEKGQWL